jgi:mono/diheme cytochrome c family protein
MKSTGKFRSIWSLIAMSLMGAALLLAGCDKKDDAGKAEETSQTASATSSTPSKGVGPIQSVELGSGIDEALAAKGEKLFSGTCAACHKLDARYVGPALNGVTLRRTPEWIMNMIMNPTGMTQQDDTARELLAQYMTQMSVSVTEDEARSVLEFFRKNDATNPNKP